jgi:hypothetical protein
MENTKKIKRKIFYECNNCNYLTSVKKDYSKHLETNKHKTKYKDSIVCKQDIIENEYKEINIYDDINVNINVNNNNDNDIDIDVSNNNIEDISDFKKQYICVCGKSYKHRSGLSYHKNKCNLINCSKNENINSNVNNDSLNYKEMFLEMMNQNKLLQNTISELIPKIGNNNNNNINIINSNINFLNDKCKDAITMDEFIESIEIKVKDLLTTAKKGLPHGLSHLFLEHYNNLPLVKRPLWCSDKKRKKLFIKEEEWMEDINHEKTKGAIKSLAIKQTKNIKKYINENPDFMNNDKKKEDYVIIVKETTTDIDNEKQNNIINCLLNNIHLTDENRETISNV